MVVTRKADVVADALLRRIVRGDLSVGEILPRESELAEAFGVNRSVIREAVKLLEVHRLVRPRRRRGTEVLDPLASMSPEVLRAMLMPTPGEIDVAVLEDLLEVRAQLDEQMTVLAAARRTDDDLVAMDAALLRIQEASEADDSPAYARAIHRLGLATALASGNRLYPMLAHWHARVMTDLGNLLGAVRRPSGPHVQGLALLVELIRRRDAEAARTLVRAYHAWATPELMAAARRANTEPF